MPNYANLYKIMHAIDPILLSYLQSIISKTRVKYLADPISSFLRKSGTDRQRKRRDKILPPPTP